jgi:hypothetical protein
MPTRLIELCGLLFDHALNHSPTKSNTGCTKQRNTLCESGRLAPAHTRPVWLTAQTFTVTKNQWLISIDQLQLVPVGGSTGPPPEDLRSLVLSLRSATDFEQGECLNCIHRCRDLANLCPMIENYQNISLEDLANVARRMRWVWSRSTGHVTPSTVVK